MTLHVHDDEDWKPLPDLPGYEVSDRGRVRSYRAHGGNRRGDRLVADPHLKSSRIGTNGYLTVALQVAPGRTSRFTIHSLVAQAFLGPRPPGLQVCHGDGNRRNNRLENLRYATPKENAMDKHLHGTTCRGETDGNSKLTETQVMEIRRQHASGDRQIDIAAAYGISQSQVSNIIRGAAWAHLRQVG